MFNNSSHSVSEEPCKEDGSPVRTKKTKSRKTEPEISFTKALDTDLSHVFAPPKNPKLLLLPANRTSCNRLLPEDCHYQPENLVKLFLRSNVTVNSSCFVSLLSADYLKNILIAYILLP